MKKSMIIMAAIGIPTFINAAAVYTNVQARTQLVIAIQDSGVSIGTDAGTTTYPNAGFNTMPTKDVGNENKTYNPDAPASKPFQAPAFSPPPPFATPPAYTPPSTQGGKTHVHP